MHHAAPDSNPHLRQPLLQAGAPLQGARAVLISLHGRGASAHEAMDLGAQVAPPQAAAQGLCLLAPQATQNSWYPNRFITPAAGNEPWLSWALACVWDVVDLTLDAGVPAERVLLLGFSQGACLALEAAARRPLRYGGVAGLSGALIENGDQPRSYAGNLAGVPVFLGCSDVDFHIPQARVERSRTLLEGLGAQVTMRIYPGLGHTVNADEIATVRALIDGALAGA